MSDLKPKGIPVMLDGEERHLLFTLNVIDEVQEHYDCSLEEVIEKLTDKKESVKTLRYLVTVLLNDEVERLNPEGSRTYTEKEAGWMIDQGNMPEVLVAVLKAYGLSLPEPDEFESPNAQSGQTE